jgi:hypothetical protein
MQNLVLIKGISEQKAQKILEACNKLVHAGFSTVRARRGGRGGGYERRAPWTLQPAASPAHAVPPLLSLPLQAREAYHVRAAMARLTTGAKVSRNTAVAAAAVT